jgi:hypothetical protein
MKNFSFALLALTLAILTGCSNQWREADAEITPEEMMAMLDEVQSAQGQSLVSGDVSTALAMKDEPGVAIFFADAPGPLGPVASVLSIGDFNFIGQSGLSYSGISEARIFFFDNPTSGGRQNGLILAIKQADGGSFSYYGFTGNSSIEDGEFVAVLGSNGQEKLVLRSFDVDGDDLAGVIQLQVYEIEAGGNERYIGKFSTLVGFGG